ncbi:biotin transporter BioY [Rhizobium straminoryzae]|uniref:Biotin transporter n=1 Tax=Rhizobium straminoryzae TaxID=1387186 RepID=A0A549TCS8_9HYPH|nr:biotin transporter BioY [Rhizobium straminoryzae]TRL39706.1 biotin transporter BioY [Rhizobium straminoryzae]
MLQSTPAPHWRTLSRQAALAVGGAALITLSAKLQIPFWPVPMTLHTLAVMAIAVAAGPRLALATLATYLAAGAAGLPVFSGTPERGIGIAYMMGPTGGYLAGYLISAGVTAWLAKGRGTLGRIGAMLCGLAVIYALGLAWLAQFVPGDRVMAVGLLPFLPADLVKVALVAAGATLPWGRLGGLSGGPSDGPSGGPFDGNSGR